MDDHAAEARKLFLNGANCAQSVLGAFHRECGIELETALKLSSGFGGGVARLREVCGAVSGMVMAAGLLRGYSDLADKTAKDAHYALIQRLAAEFRAANGSIVCRELLGLPAETVDAPVSETRTGDYYRKRPCVELVALAAAILERELAATMPK
ncbi:MAG: C-GCAxxG-C-C family protein [Victivallaceae bacterium]